MAVDLHGTGITVKLIEPGPVDTEIWDRQATSPGSISFTVIPVPCRSTAIDSLHPHSANLLAQ